MEQDEQTKEFIRKAREVHGDTYNYSKVEYKNNLKEVVIICNEHGEFIKLPKSHKKGSGCVICKNNKLSLSKRSNITEFIEKAQEIHGDKYYYSKVEYITAQTKVIITCKEHGDFEQVPNSHLRGAGCRICSNLYSSLRQKSNITEFIEKAQEIHGDKYDYSKVEYINSQTKVIITCKEHGDFEQRPNHHLRGAGCRICANLHLSLIQKSNITEFIEKAQEIHGDKYDYSKVEYINSQTKVIITCKEHGDFEQVPNSHLQGSGCSKCSGRLIYDKDSFIEKAQEIHCNKYDYKNVIYNGIHEKIKIICKEHGEFEQTPSCHIHKTAGCSKCIGRLVYDKSSFIEKAQEIHGDKYDYSKVEYINSQTKVIITCKEHGDFEQVPSSHLQGCGCKMCGILLTIEKQTCSIQEFINKAKQIHGDKYDYSNVIYKGANEKVTIICKKHGDFSQTPSKHINAKQGCSLCINKTESKLYEKLLVIYPTLTIQFKKDWCKRLFHLPYDFCIPECKIIIELDGEQHFKQVANWSSPEEQFENDKFKEKCANQNGYSIIRLLQEDVFYDTYDWVKELCDAIEEVKSSEGITNVYLCKNGEYEQF
jgi:very-short-patch-repair endonuclease